MDTKLNRIIYWAPRVMGIMLVLFLALFSLDVFDLATSPMDLVVGLLMHNIPSILLILLLVVSWRRAWPAGIVLPILGLAYSLSNPGEHWSVHVAITLPLVLVGLLFLLSWYVQKKQHLVHKPETGMQG